MCEYTSVSPTAQTDTLCGWLESTGMNFFVQTASKLAYLELSSIAKDYLPSLARLLQYHPPLQSQPVTLCLMGVR